MQVLIGSQLEIQHTPRFGSRLLSSLHRLVVTEVSATLPAILLGVLLPEFILTLVFSYPNYLLTRLAVRVFSGGAAGTVKQND